MRKILSGILFFIFFAELISCNYAGSSKNPDPPVLPDGEVTWFQNEEINDMFLYEGAVLWGTKVDGVTDLSGNPVYFCCYEYSIIDEDKYYTTIPQDKNKVYYCEDNKRSPGFYFKPSEDEKDIKQTFDISNVIEYYTTSENRPFLWKIKFNMGEDTYLTGDSFDGFPQCKLTANTTGKLYKNAATVIIPEGGTLYGDNDNIDDVNIEPNGKLQCDKMVFDNETIYFIVDFEPN